MGRTRSNSRARSPKPLKHAEVRVSKGGRSSDENKERAFVAASRRQDRSIEARLQSARQASELHFKRTGRRLKVSEEIVARDDMYEEEDDDMPHAFRAMSAHLHTGGSGELSKRVSDFVANRVALATIAAGVQHEEWMNHPVHQAFNSMFPSYQTAAVDRQRRMSEMQTTMQAGCIPDDTDAETPRRRSMGMQAIAPVYPANTAAIVPQSLPYRSIPNPAAVSSHTPILSPSSSMSSPPTSHASPTTIHTSPDLSPLQQHYSTIRTPSSPRMRQTAGSPFTAEPSNEVKRLLMQPTPMSNQSFDKATATDNAMNIFLDLGAFDPAALTSEMAAQSLTGALSPFAIEDPLLTKPHIPSPSEASEQQLESYFTVPEHVPSLVQGATLNVDVNTAIGDGWMDDLLDMSQYDNGSK